ncbi:dpoa decarboxylase [Salmonella enterica]|uniref:Dpoa decarboxylase n=1 Tax=Salmonella enterica TaxID=28901 RepID=A0A5U2K364_SALER|nr:dpoa decarboxylase [Salmonella enterica]EBP3896191.1 dpoa decarboxylase [Salmonella enterica subsp. enterica]EKB3222923.1 dpoa decarboxylase [Salmonella enterica subsp. enterica serovar Gaminara]EAM3156727.1 dpoa decarboxylase [Salmonella enterica]EAM8498332.1 dpoa decarboxylase [Salmonella enterica]
MNNEHLFISNIYSTNQDRISVTCIYDSLSKEAHHGCGLYYEIYESRFIALLRHHLSLLNKPDAEKLRRYAESQGTIIDDETYHAALNAERECRAEIAREQR